MRRRILALAAAAALLAAALATAPPAYAAGKPKVTTQPATSITSTSATLNGTVDPNGKSTTAQFGWGLTTSYGTQTPQQSVGSGTSYVPISATITGLTPGTTYYFRTKATNSSGTVYAAGLNFTTAPAAVPGDIQYRGATTGDSANNTVTSQQVTLPAGSQPGDMVFITLRAGATGETFTQTGGTGTWVIGKQASDTAGGYSYLYASLRLPSGFTAPTFSWGTATRTVYATLGLYSASGAPLSLDGGIAETDTATAGTSVTPPAKTASGSGEASVILTAGRAAAANSPTSFAYTPPSGWAEGAGEVYSPGSQNARLAFSAYDLGLPAGTVTPGAETVTDNASDSFYFSAAHYLVSSSPPQPPAVTTGAATGISASGATLNGTVNPEGAATTCHFNYGTTTAYGSATAGDTSPGSGTTAVPVSATVTGLTASTGYHFQLECSNSAGDTKGADASFTTAAASGFVTRSGQQLLLNGNPYRFIGFNEWRAAITSWNQPPSTSYLLNDGTALSDGLTTIQATCPGCNVIRVWAMQQFALNSAGNPTPSLPYDWAAIDKVLNVAAAHGMKVIMVLEDNWGYERYNSGTPSLTTAWYSGGYSTDVLPYDAVPYRQWVNDITARYAGNTAVLGWEPVNEADVSGGGSCPANAGTIATNFYSDISGLIHANDPNHLILPGTAGEVCGFNGQDMSSLLALPHIDAASFHDYTGVANAGGTWGGGNGLDDVAARAAAADKPVYVGEVGIHLNTSPVNGDPNVRASYLNSKMSTQFGYGNLAGYTPWQWDSRGVNGTGDDYVYPAAAGSPDPALPVMNNYTLP